MSVHWGQAGIELVQPTKIKTENNNNNNYDYLHS
jgi:hypothetical protein